MSKILKYGILSFFICWFTSGLGQNLPANVCRVENNRLVFVVDKTWNPDQKNEFKLSFGLDSAWLAEVLDGKTEFENDGALWKVKKKNRSLVEVSKNLNAKKSGKDLFSSLRLLNELIEGSQKKQTPDFAQFGKNQLLDPKGIIQTGDEISIRLQGNDQAKKVFISGSFNKWGTEDTPMMRVPDGWLVKLNLKPGKYFYKFIVDGDWTTDPNNALSEKDLEWNTNSVLYVTNYRFRLNGFPDADHIFLSGSFNQFRPDELELQKDREGNYWYLDMFLGEGTHYYKFIIDGSWITDPENPWQQADGRGNINSVIALGTAHPFVLNGFQNALRVTLAGNFNDWNDNQLQLKKTENHWVLDYVLGPGTYTYKFIVDGTWMPDPENPYTIGQQNYTNSVLTIQPNYTFTLEGYQEAKEVIVTGSFNEWSKDGYRMKHLDNQWIFPIYLAPGKYRYKFIIDGNFVLDPSNDLWEENEFGTGNSVIWIE